MTRSHRFSFFAVLPPTVLGLLLNTAFAKASAQQIPGGQSPSAAVTTPDRPTIPAHINVHLLARPEVQAHLHLTVRQKNELGLNPGPGRNKPSVAGGGAMKSAEAAGRNFSTKLREVNGQSGNLSPEEQRQAIREMTARLHAEADAQQKASEDAARRVLSSAQLKRLVELDLQLRGPAALGDTEMAEQVQLSAQQRAQIAAILTEAEKQVGKVMFAQTTSSRRPRPSNAPNNRLSPKQQQMHAIEKEAEAKILALLTPEQAEHWQQAQGTPFTFRTDQQD